MVSTVEPLRDSDLVAPTRLVPPGVGEGVMKEDERIAYMAKMATQGAASQQLADQIKKMTHKELDGRIGDFFSPLTLRAKRQVMQLVATLNRLGHVRKTRA